MAPREATGAFPDQYLTFDYDASAPVVMPHDVAPMGAGAENDEQSFGDQTQTQHDPAPVTVTTAQNNHTGTVTPLPGSDPLGNDPLPDSTSSYGGNRGGNSRPLQSTTSSSDVDPLSIDPTLHNPSPWGSSENGVVPMDSLDTHPQVGSSRSRFLSSQSSDLSAGQIPFPGAPPANVPLSQTGLGGVTAVSAVNAPVQFSAANVVSPYGSFRSSSSSSLLQSVPTPSVGSANLDSQNGYPSPVAIVSRASSRASSDSSHASGSSAPLSTGSSALNFTSPPNSPLDVEPQCASSAVEEAPVPIVGAAPSPVHSELSPASESRRRIRPHPYRPLTSVLDNSTSLESDDEDEGHTLLPGLDTTDDSGVSFRTASAHPSAGEDEENGLPHSPEDEGSHSDAGDSAEEPPQISQGSAISDEDDSTETYHHHHHNNYHPVPNPASPSNHSSSTDSSGSLRMLHQSQNFDISTSSDSVNGEANDSPMPPQLHRVSPQSASLESASGATSPLLLSFGPNTTVSDLKYFAERGCIVALLAAATTPRLKVLGTRMLADYAKMPARRVAVASNRRILEFVQRTMLENGSNGITEEERGAYVAQDWLGREYAVETVRSLTATEESDRYLMGAPGLLKTLALVARGGPFVTRGQMELYGPARGAGGLASAKARLHACIAVMNLSCGKANKIEIAKVPEVLEAMRDVMVGAHFLSSHGGPSTTGSGVSDEARLKATTCVKNLSNADANDAALLGTPGLVEALGHVAGITCTPDHGATTCTTNACLALMNLSISKSNKHRVFRTPGVMDALMAVITHTSPSAEGDDSSRETLQGANAEARVKACSALSNLAIGYDNKIPMFAYPGFVDAILHVIETDGGEARTKACSILWSFAAEMKNQVPVVQRGDILPTLVRVAEEDGTTEARFKCVAALTLLAESLDNALPLLESGALAPLMDILHDAGPDPTQWKGQTASWCVGFLMNMAQSDEAVPALREAGVVELLAPLLTLDHYQSLKAAMAVTFVCRYDEGDETYDLLRKTENVIPKIISLLHNTLSGRGGNGYKYGVFTLRSSVGCISSLASGPDFMKERIATGPVFESLLRVLTDFCVDGGTPGAIVGGGRDDALSATLAIRALQNLTGHLIPIPGSSALPFGPDMDERLITALDSFEICTHPEIAEVSRRLATDTKMRIRGSQKMAQNAKGKTRVPTPTSASCMLPGATNTGDEPMGDMASVAATLASNCCGLESLPGIGEDLLQTLYLPHHQPQPTPQVSADASADASQQGMEIIDLDEPISLSRSQSGEGGPRPVRTFLLADSRTGRRFAVPTDPSGGRAFNDTRVWCYRRGRFCLPGEVPDANFRWTDELQNAYVTALAGQRRNSSSSSVGSRNGLSSAVGS